jgi:hypothetical protein
MKRLIKYFLIFISLVVLLTSCSGPKHRIDIENSHYESLKIKFSVTEASGDDVRIDEIPSITEVDFYISNSEGDYSSEESLLWQIISSPNLSSPLAELTYGVVPQGFKGSTARQIRPKQKILIKSEGTGGFSINRPEIVLQ